MRVLPYTILFLNYATWQHKTNLFEPVPASFPIFQSHQEWTLRIDAFNNGLERLLRLGIDIRMEPVTTVEIRHKIIMKLRGIPQKVLSQQFITTNDTFGHSIQHLFRTK